MKKSTSSNKAKEQIYEKLNGALKYLKEAENPTVRLTMARLMRSVILGPITIYRKQWIKESHVIDTLITVIKENHPTFIEEITMILSRIAQSYFRDYRILPVLIPLLKSKRKITRLWAIRGIAALGKENIWIELLIPLLKDKDPSIRCSTMFGIRIWLNERKLTFSYEIKSQLMPLLFENLLDSNKEVLEHTIGTLKAIGDISCLHPLTEALKREQNEIIRDLIENAIHQLKQNN